jgi:hypothetical protein
LCSCVGKIKEPQKLDWKELISQTIKKEGISDDEDQLYLFIADNMCSECITKEYMNIKSDSIGISIIGVFNDKRNFIASTNIAFMRNRIFIDRTPQHSNIIPNQPIYFIYNKTTEAILEIFYPVPCEEEKTLNYFQKIRKTYSISK